MYERKKKTESKNTNKLRKMKVNKKEEWIKGKTKGSRSDRTVFFFKCIPWQDFENKLMKVNNSKEKPVFGSKRMEAEWDGKIKIEEREEKYWKWERWRKVREERAARLKKEQKKERERN